MSLTVGRTYRCALVWLLNGTDLQVNVHYVSMGGSQPASEVAARTDLYAYFNDLYADVIVDVVDNIQHQRIDVWDALTGNPEFTGSASTPLHGTGTAEMLPEAASAFVYGRTGIKRRIARKFLPTFGETSLVDGVWSSTVQTRLQAFCDKWETTYTGANGSTWHAVVFTPPSIFTDISEALYSTRPAYQRRRRLGRGG